MSVAACSLPSPCAGQQLMSCSLQGGPACVPREASSFLMLFTISALIIALFSCSLNEPETQVFRWVCTGLSRVVQCSHCISPRCWGFSVCVQPHAVQLWRPADDPRFPCLFETASLTWLQLADSAASKPQAFGCFCFPSAGATVMCYHVPLSRF